MPPALTGSATNFRSQQSFSDMQMDAGLHLPRRPHDSACYSPKRLPASAGAVAGRSWVFPIEKLPPGRRLSGKVTGLSSLGGDRHGPKPKGVDGRYAHESQRHSVRGQDRIGGQAWAAGRWTPVDAFARKMVADRLVPGLQICVRRRGAVAFGQRVRPSRRRDSDRDDADLGLPDWLGQRSLRPPASCCSSRTESCRWTIRCRGSFRISPTLSA